MKFLSILSAGIATAAAVSQQFPLLKENSQLIDLHRELCERSSVSGTEHDVGAWLYKYLENRGYTVESQVVDKEKGRFNIYAYLGNNRNTKTLLTSHIDTVPPYIPYTVEGDKIKGRGTVDAKNCVAAQITALEEMRTDNEVKEGDASLLFVVGEEVGGDGMKLASEVTNADWDTVIFGEPTELKLGVGHKGILLAKFKVHGKAAHSGYPELGINANTILVNAMAELINTELPSDSLLGPSTINIGSIEGGVASNVIPAYAEASVAIRVASDLDNIVAALNSIATNDEHIELEIVQSVSEQHLSYKVDGFDSIVLAYATDVPNLSGNFTRYLYGSGSIHVAHSDDEFVTRSELIESVDGYKKLVRVSL